MTNAKRGRGSRPRVYFCAVAALGLALSGCHGGGASPAASATQSSTATQSSSPSNSATIQGASVPQTSAPAPGASAGSVVPAGASTATTSVTLNWTPPTENIDGTTLRNLAGYNIHYGTASHRYTQTIAITNPGIATYVVESLTPGTYYFAVAAVNSAGTESPLSSEVSTTVN